MRFTLTSSTMIARRSLGRQSFVFVALPWDEVAASPAALLDAAATDRYGARSFGESGRVHREERLTVEPIELRKSKHQLAKLLFARRALLPPLA
jgi:hypothetical protein